MPFSTSTFVKSGKFRNVQDIGQGSYGRVYRAEDIRLARFVAVKEVLPSNPQYHYARMRFEKESRIQAQVQHPNIVTVYALEEDPETGELYLFCEYATEGSLAKYLQSQGKLPEKAVVNIGLAICHALEATSARKIVHRDIKPTNIMISRDNKKNIVVKLGDFGIAQDLQDTKNTVFQGGSHPGTPLYMAPEQTDSTTVLDVRADIYALGITLWEMITGIDYKPLLSETDEPDLLQYNTQASKGFAAVIKKALQRNRNFRYNNPTEMASDLQAVMAGKPPKIALQPIPDHHPISSPDSSSLPSSGPKRKPTRRGFCSGCFISLLLLLLAIGSIGLAIYMLFPNVQTQVSHAVDRMLTQIPIYVVQTATPPAIADAQTPTEVTAPIEAISQSTDTPVLPPPPEATPAPTNTPMPTEVPADTQNPGAITSCYEPFKPNPTAAKPQGDWAIRSYDQDDIGAIFINGKIFHTTACCGKDSGWVKINDLLVPGNNEIIMASWDTGGSWNYGREIQYGWGYGIQHDNIQVWGNELAPVVRNPGGDKPAGRITYINRLWITPEGKVEPVETLEKPSTPPEGPWYVRIESIDDVGVILINGMPVVLDADGVDTGWRNITSKLSTNCDSTIQMLAWNFGGPWSYKFSIMRGDTIVWAAEKSGSGSTGLFFDQNVIITGDGEVKW